MVDFIIPPPPKEEESGGFKIPPPPDVDDKAIQNIASDGFVIPPTPEQVKENDGRLSEAELKKDPEWIRVAKSIYEFNEGTTLGFEKDGKPKKLNSDKEYADYALRYMGWFNYNIPKMGNEALDLFQFANQQQKEDFVKAMDMYDNKKISWAGAGRFIKGVGFDPSTYVGIATLGTGLVARAGAKEAAKQGIKEFVKQGAVQGAAIGAIEGAAYSTVDNALRQSARIMSGQREGFDFGESGQSALFGAGVGGALGGTIGGTAAYFKNKNNVVPSVTKDGEDFVLPPKPEELKETFVGPKGELVDTPVAETPVAPAKEKLVIDFLQSNKNLPKSKIKKTATSDIAKELGISINEASNIVKNLRNKKVIGFGFGGENKLFEDLSPEYQKANLDVLARDKQPKPSSDLYSTSNIDDDGFLINEPIQDRSPFAKVVNDIESGDKPNYALYDEDPLEFAKNQARASRTALAGYNLDRQYTYKDYLDDFDITPEQIQALRDRGDGSYLSESDFAFYNKSPREFEKQLDKLTKGKTYQDFINQPKAQTAQPPAPKVETPKVETPKRGTKIPEILKITKEPKVRTARDYIGKVEYGEKSGELQAIFEDYRGNISRKFVAGKGEKGNNLDTLDILAEGMAEDGYYTKAEYESGEPLTNRILEDLQNDTPHRDDVAIYAEWERRTDQAKTVRKVLDDNNINYKGMTDQEVMQTYDDIVNDRLPPARDEMPDDVFFEMYADEIQAASSGGNINNVKAEDVIDPAPDGRDFQTDTTTGLNQRVIDVGMQIMDELEIPRNPNVRISDQLKEAVLLANSSPKFMDKFVETLKKNNLTVEELSTVFRESISDSARRMQQLSTASKTMKRIGQELGEIAPDEGWYANFAKEYTDIIRELDNIRRGLLVSQIATAMRNNTAQLGRVGMRTLIESFDDILNRTFNPLRKAFGKETVPVDYTKSFGLLMNLTKNKKKAKEITDFLTKYYVNESDRLFTKYASEVADSSKSKVLKGAQKMVDGLNFLNRMQEFWYRRGMFATSIKDTLALKGIDINKVEINEDLLKHLNASDIEKAVDDALFFTYAKTPTNKALKAFVDLSNSIPFVTTGLIPFARFMANAIEFQFKHSPVGFGLLLRPKEIKKIAAGDTTAFSQAVIGSTILMATIEAKRKGMAEDHKWYELETTKGKTVDMRPYFPLTPYLFVADVITRIESGRNWGDAKDILQALSGAQFRAGASLQLIQNLLDGLGGLDTEEKVNKFMSDYVSDVLGGFLTPLRMFNDFIEQEQDFRAPVPTGEFLTDTTNRLKTSVPIVREQFPELQSPTRAAAPGRPDTVTLPIIGAEVPGPLTRQLTGATVREEKNIAEREFDRLGYKRRDILPYSGNAVVDQTRAEYLGPLIETVIPVLVQSEQYQSKTNQEKNVLLRQSLKLLRDAANDYIKENKINEEAFAKAAFNRQPKYIKALLNSQGITAETFLENYDTQVGANR